MSMISSWGRHGWTFLHCVSFSYPDLATFEERIQMFDFLKSLGDILPCKICRAHYKKHINKHITSPNCKVLVSRESLSAYIVILHNDVNERIGKPKMEYRKVYNLYMPENETADEKSISFAVSIGVLIMVLIIVGFIGGAKCNFVR